MNSLFKSSLWYDSWWLQTYLAVRSYLERKKPEKLETFETLIASLRTDPGFSVRELRGLFDNDELSEMRNEVERIRQDDLDSSEFFSFGRHLVRNDPFFCRLQDSLTATVEEQVGEPLDLCYNFLSLYNNFGECPIHMDAPEAKWTVDICIEQSDVWPISFSEVIDWPTELIETENAEEEFLATSNLSFEDYTLHEGDALIFSGSSQWHFRKPIPKKSSDNFCHLVFLHYVPKNSDHAVDVEMWADYLNEPEVGDIVRAMKRSATATDNKPAVYDGR